MKTSRIFFFVLCIFFLLNTPIFANSKIISANSFSEIKKLMVQNKQPGHLLLVLDDDDTLTMMPCPPYSAAPHSTQCQYLGGPAWYAWQSKLPAASKERIWKTFPELLAINNFIFTISTMPLDDPAIPSTLRTADQLGASVIVASARGYSMLGATEKQFTQDHIMSLIEKDAVRTPTNHISIPGYYFPTPWNNHAVRRIAYLHGVLYLAGQNKGIMLQQFLAKTKQTKNIKTIIFVDDTLQCVLDVANAYKNDPNVNVISVHFTRLAKHKAAFLTGAQAKELQAIANHRWQEIKLALTQNVPGFLF